jgi:hypothetical protein
MPLFVHSPVKSVIGELSCDRRYGLCASTCTYRRGGMSASTPRAILARAYLAARGFEISAHAARANEKMA